MPSPTPAWALRPVVAAIQVLFISIAAAYSLAAGWAEYLAQKKNDAVALETALQWQKRLGRAAWRRTAFALAELLPEREREFLGPVVHSEGASAEALVRWALLEEFAGRRGEAIEAMDRARQKSRRYKVLLAGAAQAARFEQEDRLLDWAKEALRNCPRDADDIFHLIAKAPRGSEVLAGTSQERRVDYLRFLVGQEDYLEALEYYFELEGSGMAATGTARKLREELTERLILSGQWEAASRLHPNPDKGGVENARFESEPSSLGFDWRLAKSEGLQLEWRPGQLRMRLKEQPRRIELLSQYVRHKGEGKVQARWQGNLGGLRWEQEKPHPEWMRISLVAEPGAERELRLEEVRIAKVGGDE